MCLACRWAITLSKVSLSSATWTQAMIPVPQTLHTWHGNIVELQRRLLVTLLSVLFFYYPSLLTTILSLFACYRIDPSSPTGAYPQFARVSACLMCCTQVTKLAVHTCKPDHQVFWHILMLCFEVCLVTNLHCHKMPSLLHIQNSPCKV